MFLKIAIVVLLLVSACAGEEDAVSPDYTKKVAAFESWYKERNPTVEKITLGVRPSAPNILGNASVFLTIESIGEGDAIFEAPEELVITLQTVEDSPIGSLVKTNNKLESSLSTLEKLALFFLYSRNCVPSKEKFFWSTYVAALPDADDLNHILLMTEEELEILKGSFAYETAKELKARSRQTFNLLNSELFQDEDVDALMECTSLTETSWNWAMATVMARHMRFVDLSSSDTSSGSFPAIVPYYDFIGHYPTVSSLNGRTAEGIYHAELEYFEDKEVFRGITADCNAMLLVRTGLFLDNSPFPCSTLPTNFFDVYASKASSPELEEKRQEGFEKLREAAMNFVFHVFESTITEELLLRAEMVTMTIEDYNSIDTEDDDLRELLSMKTRMRALRWIRDSVLQYLKTFPSSIEEDAAKLADSNWTSSHSRRAQTALKVIHEEKHVLKNFCDSLESHIAADGATQHDEL